MGKTLKVMMTASLIILFTSVLLAAELDDLKKAAVKIKTLSADFIQEKNLKILSKPITSKGKLYFKAPHAIRWEYLTPVKSLSLMNKDGARVFTFSEGKWIIDKAQSDARGIVMEELNNWFAGNFADSRAFTHSFKSGPMPQIILTPKEGVNNFISQIILKISARTGLVEVVEIGEKAGNSTKIIFRNEKVNTDIPDNLFEKP